MVKPTKPWLTIGEVAQMMRRHGYRGCSRMHIWRVLRAMDEQCNHMLLRDVSKHHKRGIKQRPVWRVSVAVLDGFAKDVLPPERPADGPQMGVHVEMHNRAPMVMVGCDAA